MSRTTSSSNGFYPSPSLTAHAPARPATAMGVAGFVGNRASRQQQRSPWTSTGVKEPSFSAIPPSGQAPTTPKTETPTEDDDYQSSQFDERDYEQRGQGYGRVSEMLLGVPPGGDRTGHLFDADETLSFSGGTVTVSQKERLDNLRLPVPTFENEAGPLQAPWTKRGMSDDSIVELETKPDIFGIQKEGGGESETGDTGGGYFDGNNEDTDFGSDGYHHNYEQEDFKTENGGLDQYKQKDGEEAFNEGIDRYAYGREQQQHTSLDNLGHLWDETTPTFTTDAWNRPLSAEVMPPPMPPLNIDMKGKGKAAQDVEYHSRQPRSNGSPSPKSRQVLPVGGSKRPASPRFNFAPAPQQIRQTQLQALPARPNQTRVIRKLATAKPQQRELQPENHTSAPEPHSVVSSPPPQPSAENNKKLPTQELPVTPRPDAFRPLLSDSALLAILTYAELAATLASMHRSSRAASLSPDQLASELSALANHAFPTRDESRPRTFLARLGDDDYARAGELIVQRKRELEEHLGRAAHKRRRLAEEMQQQVETVAAVRVARLQATVQRREQLRGQIGGLLKMGGLDL